MACDPVGLQEIAERLGVKQGTAWTWHNRGILPTPRWSTGGRPLWNWPDVAKWARESGRTPTG